MWTAPQIVDMADFDRRMLARFPGYNATERYYGGLWWGTIGTRTGMWLYQPTDYTSCPGAFTGLGVIGTALTFN